MALCFILKINLRIHRTFREYIAVLYVILAILNRLQYAIYEMYCVLYEVRSVLKVIVTIWKLCKTCLAPKAELSFWS